MRDFITVLLTAIYTMSVVASNFFASKVFTVTIPVVGDVFAPAGVFALALAFLCSDLLAELVSERYARTVANSAIASLVVAVGLAYVAVAVDPAPFYAQQEAFASVMLSSVPIFVASITTLLVSQNIDVFLFGRLREITGDSHKWVRNIGSTSVSQLIDTALFIGLGFVILPPIMGGTATPIAAAASLIGTQYALKVILALSETPVFYAGTYIAETYGDLSG